MSAASITPLLQRSPLPPPHHHQDLVSNNNNHNHKTNHHNGHHPSISLTDQNDEIDIDYYDDGGGGGTDSSGRPPISQLTDSTNLDNSINNNQRSRQNNSSIVSISSTAAGARAGGGGKRDTKRYQIRTIASLDSLQNLYNKNNKVDIADPSEDERVDNNDGNGSAGIRVRMASASSGRFETPPSSPNQSMNGNRGCCFCWRPSLRNAGMHGNTLQPGGPPSSATFGAPQPTSESSSSSHSSRHNKSGGANQASSDSSAASYDEVLDWGKNFEKLMKSPRGRRKFRDFLKGEYSEENILFWQAVEDLKRETNPAMVEERARMIYEDFISILSPKEVSLDSRVRDIVNKNMVEPSFDTFDEAQLQIYTLMHRDSYPRFINSPLYKQLLDETRPRGGGDVAREAAALAAATAATAVSTASAIAAAASAAAAATSRPNSNSAIKSSRASVTAANVLGGSRQGSISSGQQQTALSHKRPNSRGTVGPAVGGGGGGKVTATTVVAGSVTSLRSAGGGSAAASSSRHPLNKPKLSSSSISNAANSSAANTAAATSTASGAAAITHIDPHSTGSATTLPAPVGSSTATISLQR